MNPLRRTADAPPGLLDLFDSYWSKLPDGSLEPSTITDMRIHQRQLERHFRTRFSAPGRDQRLPL